MHDRRVGILKRTIALVTIVGTLCPMVVTQVGCSGGDKGVVESENPTPLPDPGQRKTLGGGAAPSRPINP